MKKLFTLLMSLLLSAVAARAEIRQAELSIFGMD
jgi:hypothetical protein